MFTEDLHFYLCGTGYSFHKLTNVDFKTSLTLKEQTIYQTSMEVIKDGEARQTFIFIEDGYLTKLHVGDWIAHKSLDYSSCWEAVSTDLNAALNILLEKEKEGRKELDD